MASFFHQNMRRFGGGSVPRRNAFNGAMPPGGAFGAISAAVGAGPVGPVAVAGFTEVTNNAAAAGALANSAISLGQVGGAGAVVGLAGCGKTALARGNWEYVGITIRPGWAVLTVGRILLGVNQGIALLHQRSATFGGLNGLGAPQGMSFDYRGLVYVVVTIPGGPNIAVGFLHNLYTFQAQRVLVAGQLPQMAAMMGAAIPGGPGAVGPIAARYIGGDFNVRMQTPRGTPRQGQVFGVQQGLTLAQTPAGAVAGGTTWSGSLYDYWYSDIAPGAVPALPLVAPVPSVFPNTLNHGPGVAPAGSMSDHAGVSLRFT